jgi:hypothetical protein
MAQLLSAYWYDGEFFPCLGLLNPKLITGSGLHRWRDYNSAVGDFVAFCSRTGRGALTAEVTKLSEFILDCHNRRSSVDDLQRHRLVPDSVIICGNDECQTDLTGSLFQIGRFSILGLASPSVRACPRCGGEGGVLLFRLRPRATPRYEPKSDGEFWGIVAEDNGLAFEKTWDG